MSGLLRCNQKNENTKFYKLKFFIHKASFTFGERLYPKKYSLK